MAAGRAAATAVGGREGQSEAGVECEGWEKAAAKAAILVAARGAKMGMVAMEETKAMVATEVVREVAREVAAAMVAACAVEVKMGGNWEGSTEGGRTEATAEAMVETLAKAEVQVMAREVVTVAKVGDTVAIAAVAMLEVMVEVEAAASTEVLMAVEAVEASTAAVVMLAAPTAANMAVAMAAAMEAMESKAEGRVAIAVATREAVAREVVAREAVTTEAAATEAVATAVAAIKAMEKEAVETARVDWDPAAAEAMALGLAERAEAVQPAEAEVVARALANAGWAVGTLRLRRHEECYTASPVARAACLRPVQPLRHELVRRVMSCDFDRRQRERARPPTVKRTARKTRG